MQPGGGGWGYSIQHFVHDEEEIISFSETPASNINSWGTLIIDGHGL